MKCLDGSMIGKLSLTNGAIIIDPCYFDGEGGIPLKEIKAGTYEAVAIWHGDYVKTLYVLHDTCKVAGWIKVNEISVDSGQVCIAELEKFSKDDYDGYCAITVDKGVGVFEDYAVVSNSGYGDGMYSVYVAKEGEKVCGILVEFIEEEDEDE